MSFYELWDQVKAWLTRSGFFVNSRGLEDFCVSMFGKPFQCEYN